MNTATSTKEVYDKIWPSREGDLLGIVQEIEICPYNQMLHAQTRIHPGKWAE